MSRIIIVDDKEQDRYLLQVLLRKSGYLVEAATNGAEALTLARNNPPDMIVSDILMPVMDGFSLCREWQKDPELRSVPFVFYTATYADPRDEEFALKLGADKFIVKPVDPASLLDLLREILAKRPLRKPAAADSCFAEEEGYFKSYSEVLVRKLEDKLELFRTIFTIDPSVILLLSASHTVLELNQTAEKLLAVRKEEILDTNFVDRFVPASHRIAFNEQINSVLSGNVARDFESAINSAGGASERMLLWNAQRLMRASGVVEGVLLIGSDITARRAAERQRAEAENQLRQAQKLEAIGRLAGGVAHDFNNILSVIVAHCDLMHKQLKKNDPLASRVGKIAKCAERAAGLTRQLLAFSREQVLEPRVLDLNAIVADVEEMLRGLVGENIELFLTLEPALDRIKADPSQIEQVLVNLAVNSRDAMPNGGKLTIATANILVDGNDAGQNIVAAPGHYVTIAVSDIGCGMNEETKARIFEPFFTTKAKGKGTGLGLATVYGIIKQSGGSICCHSEPGQGTTFKVYLPAIKEATPGGSPRVHEIPGNWC